MVDVSMDDNAAGLNSILDRRQIAVLCDACSWRAGWSLWIAIVVDACVCVCVCGSSSVTNDALLCGFAVSISRSLIH